MKKCFYSFLVCAFWISACISQNPISTQRVEPSQTVLPTTVLPTTTLIPQPTKISTSTLTPEQIVTATVQALSSGCTLISELSPDKEWVAIKCGDVKINNDDKSSTALKIVNLDSFQEWVITYFQIYGVKEIESAGGMSDGTLFVEQWSVDKGYLYIGVMPNVYTEFEFNRTAALFRLNLKTGETTEILDIEEAQNTFYDYSTSPDERRIAFIKLLKNPLQVEIKDFDTGKLQSIPLDPRFSTAGSIAWSQDNRNLIFLAVDYNNDTPFVSTTVFQWDGQEKRLKELCQLTDKLFFIVKWDEENKHVTLRDYFDEALFDLDTTNGQLTPISP